jgi:hypothetical protein
MVALLVAVFEQLQGLSYWDVLEALRQYLARTHARTHNADEQQRLANLVARLPLPPSDGVRHG